MIQPVLLEIRNLSCMRNDNRLFEALNARLEPGQMLLVEGPNGSGKTSLLRILTGLRLPDQGEVLWRGESIEKLAGEYYERINYVGHHDGIKLQLTCVENLRLARAMGIPSGLTVDEVLEQVNLYAEGEIEASALSAGQRRRLALARLLATESTLWILDEPFTSLDRNSISMFHCIFERHLQQGGAVVMTSHHQISLPGSVMPLRLG